MFVVLIPVLTCLDLVIKYAINSMDNKDLPRNIAGKIEIDKFHNKGFPFGKLKENQRVVKYIPVFITSVLIGGLSFLLPQKGKKIKKLSLSLFTRRYVVDYIRIKVKVLDKVIFNIGDIFIVLGSLMMPFGSKKKINNIAVDNTPTEE